MRTSFVILYLASRVESVTISVTPTRVAPVASEPLTVSVRDRSSISSTDWIAFYSPDVVAAWSDANPGVNAQGWSYLPATVDVTITHSHAGALLTTALP
eukprot:4017808-Prymnesium_polylepis.1